AYKRAAFVLFDIPELLCWKSFLPDCFNDVHIKSRTIGLCVGLSFQQIGFLLSPAAMISFHRCRRIIKVSELCDPAIANSKDMRKIGLKLHTGGIDPCDIFTEHNHFIAASDELLC